MLLLFRLLIGEVGVGWYGSNCKSRTSQHSDIKLKVKFLRGICVAVGYQFLSGDLSYYTQNTHQSRPLLRGLGVPLTFEAWEWGSLLGCLSCGRGLTAVCDCPTPGLLSSACCRVVDRCGRVPTEALLLFILSFFKSAAPANNLVGHISLACCTCTLSISSGCLG